MQALQISPPGQDVGRKWFGPGAVNFARVGDYRRLGQRKLAFADAECAKDPLADNGFSQPGPT